MQLFITRLRVGEPGNEATRHELIILLATCPKRQISAFLVSL